MIRTRPYSDATRKMSRKESGQGMIEYGLIVGLMSIWVVVMFVALKPIFTEQFAVEGIINKSGEGRAELAAGLGVDLNAGAADVIVGGGADGSVL